MAIVRHAVVSKRAYKPVLPPYFSKAEYLLLLPAVCRGRWRSSGTLYFQNGILFPFCRRNRRRHDVVEPLNQSPLETKDNSDESAKPGAIAPKRHWKQTIIPMRAKSHRPKWSHHAGRQHQHRQLYRNRETDVAGRGGELNMRAGVRICILTVAWIVYET
jgi:hypothetical protein